MTKHERHAILGRRYSEPCSPALLQRLSEDRERLGLRPVQMAGRLHLRFRQYRSLEAGELHIDYDLYSESPTCVGGHGSEHQAQATTFQSLSALGALHPWGLRDSHNIVLVEERHSACGPRVLRRTTLRFMELSVCVTDDEYEAWRAVRLAVEADSRCLTVEELREQDSSDRLLLLAVEDSDVVGSGIADRAEAAGAGFVAPRVLSGHRRLGVGSALLRVLAEHCSGLGLSTVRTNVDEEGSLAFAERYGFVEVDREVEQIRAVGDEPAPTGLPAGVEVIEARQRPDLWAACFETFGTEVLADFAVYTPLQISAEQWNTSWGGDPMFLALYDDEVIGCAGLNRDTDRPERAENALTGVRRTWRSRGIASHLKRQTLHWAALNGLEEIYTWTQAGNSPMLRLNEHIGYVTARNSIAVSRALPLTT